MEPKDYSYFGIQAYIGTTKHMGGAAATRELVELCRIERDEYVLDVGCGAGATAVYLAGSIGCRVMAVDLRSEMVSLAQERIQESGFADRVKLKAANALELPFDVALFDAVICESVLTFMDKPANAIAEFGRVVKPGGWVGINEQYWGKSPTQEMLSFTERAWTFRELPSLEDWEQFMWQAGLRNIQAVPQRIDPRRESSQVSRYRFKDMWRMLTRTVGLYLHSGEFREYMMDEKRLPKGLFEHLEYALVVGEK